MPNPEKPSQTITIFSPMFVDFSEEGRVAENDWYDTDHVPQRLSIPGFESAARFERMPIVPNGIDEVAPLRYINAYRISGPGVVEADPYRLSYEHLTPRSHEREFSVSPPIYRDIWKLVHSEGSLSTVDGARVLLLVADEPGGSIDDGETFLRTVAVPTMLTAPGILRAFVFRRLDAAVPLSDGVHAPRFLTAYVLSGPEVAARSELGERIEAIAERGVADGSPVARAWVGVYDRRASPWTTHPGGAFPA